MRGRYTWLQRAVAIQLKWCVWKHHGETLRYLRSAPSVIRRYMQRRNLLARRLTSTLAGELTSCVLFFASSFQSDKRRSFVGSQAFFCRFPLPGRTPPPHTHTSRLSTVDVGDLSSCESMILIAVLNRSQPRSGSMASLHLQQTNLATEARKGPWKMLVGIFPCLTSI